MTASQKAEHKQSGQSKNQEERAVRRAVRDAERSALLERDVRRQRVDLRCIAEAELGVCASLTARNVHAIANGKARNALTEGLDRPGAVVPGREGQRRQARVRARADVRLHADSRQQSASSSSDEQQSL